MRKMMSREVTKTTVKLAKMVIENGVPSVETLEDKIVLGNVNHETAQRLVTKELGQGITVLSVQPDTVVYELAVEDFISIAKPKEEVKEVSVQA